jgi:L-fucose isomerase-like protein
LLNIYIKGEVIMDNIPQINLAIVAVSRDCFPVELSQRRRKNVVAACKKNNIPIVEIQTMVENEKDVLKALEEIRQKEINALVIYLGNFGPEGPETLLAKRFSEPVMFVAAAEESGKDLINGRGDAYCGMLNASYNVGLRKLNPYIPENPVGIADEIADKISDFIPIARILSGLSQLKIFSFGPRPQDFLACNAPIKALYNLGIEIMENSELDLYDIVQAEKDNPEVKRVAKEMADELGQGNRYPDLLDKCAQYEIALIKFMQNNLGASKYGIFANKCWPAFEKYFGHVPCFINGRMAARGIPISCEVDIYGVLSEYIISCATQLPATILDINNTVPYDMIEANRNIVGNYKASDLFMGFHCGNVSSVCMASPVMKYQLIMHRLMEPGKDPNITRGTLEGRIKAGEITIFRLQSTADTRLKSYMAQGEVLDMDPKSFGSIGVFAIKEMGRFYRHVLIEKRFPHHTAVAFKHTGKYLFETMKMLGVEDISFNLAANIYYRTENPY